MPDREKVIKGVHDARRYFEDREWVDKSVGVHIDALNDAIALLKEQEEIVHPESSCEMEYITDCCCDLCGVQLIREDNFCRGCGKPIDWSK